MTLGTERRQGRSLEQGKKDDGKSDSQETREKLRGHGGEGTPVGDRPEIEKCGERIKSTLDDLMDKLNLNEDQREAFVKLHHIFAAKKKAIAVSDADKRQKYERMREVVKQHHDNLGKILTKEQWLESLAESFDAVSKQVQATSESTLSETVDFFAGPKNKLQMLQLLQDHVTHHRGQLIVYLNMKEITPPRYVGW